MTTKPANPVELLETVYSSSVKVDKENGIVTGVKFLGRQSANKRDYSDRAIDDVQKLLESVVINMDHPDKREAGRERGIMEGFAVPKNITRQADGLYGDVHCLKTHPHTPVFLEWAERFPDKLGMSQNALGIETPGKNGRLLVESVQKVRSLDLVRNPATVKSLFESEGDDWESRIQQLLESANAEQAKFVKNLLETLEKAMPAEVKPVPAPIVENTEAKPDPKLAELQEENRQLKVNAACRDLLESEGVKTNPIRLKALSNLTDDERKELVAEWKGADAGGAAPARPRTATALRESKAGDGSGDSTIPTDPKEFARLCR